MIAQIKKRDGRIVDFDSKKIVNALRQAFAALGQDVTEEQLEIIVDDAVLELANRFVDAMPGVEDVQNIVEKKLMASGFFEVARSYIIYRYEHSKVRDQQRQDLQEKIERSDLTVVKRSGQKEKFSLKKLKNSFGWVVKGFESEVDIDLMVKQTEANLFDGIKTAEIAKARVLAARSLIERDPAYSRVAVRLLFDSLYREVIGQKLDYKNLDQQYRQAFINNLKMGVQIGRLDPRLLNFNLEALSRQLKLERDDLFFYLGGQTLYDRYFISNPKTKSILETPQAFWLRVAMGLAVNEDEAEARALQFYDLISSLRFVPSTPTLFHAGTNQPQLSSCYLTTVEDSLDHIFKCVGDNAQMSKWSGGVANDWTNLRATGALIKGTGVESQGVIPFLKIANDTTVAINRSGRRRGATCAYLEAWHCDFPDFLELRKNTGDERRRTHDMNTAAWIPDLFMQRVMADQDWILFSPEETSDLHHAYGRNFVSRYTHYETLASQGKLRLFQKIKARELWKKMIMMLFETGHPWMTWKDPSNIRSPQDHVGVVHSSNLCTEITLNTTADETAVCNLGSVNLARHLKNKQLDIELLKDTVTTAMRMLDNVIDINFYPTVEGKNSNLRHRPVGLGLMGFQDALYLLDINFSSPECIDFADYSQEVISYYAILASSQLAQERGAYQSYRGSKWDRGIFPVDTLDLLEQERGETIEVKRQGKLDWQPVRQAVAKYGMRNSNCMAIAPTATIANIAGCFPSIEPIYKNVYVKSNMSGEFIIVNPYLVADLKKRQLWNEEILAMIKGHEGSIGDLKQIPEVLQDKYKEVFEIEADWLIQAAAYRGKWIDQSQSLNLFFKGNSGKKIADMYQLAWRLGLKTTYYLRTLGATAVEQSALDLDKQKSMSNIAHQAEDLTIRPSVEPVVLASASPAEVANNNLLLCKIDDPTCESCQ
ncbi:MAG: ribonucleoside-diphosphate reductase subunit alpha [Patescibacteria group bacterium]|jgi:ribonucleoside-diphosphate reductase alpha chain|nr:ribonucleoside-diphosphate reductase subunit alpha [Patescibacteria group bacterium]